MSKISEDNFLQNIYVKLAYAELDLNNIAESEQYCNLVIDNKNSNDEACGKVLNLLSIIEFQIKNNPEKVCTLLN